MNNKKKGLFDKYNVTRTDGRPIKACIVLEFTDKHARNSIVHWANHMFDNGYHELFKDVMKKITEIPPVLRKPRAKKQKEAQLNIDHGNGTFSVTE